MESTHHDLGEIYFDAARRSRMRRRLLDWFSANQRELPWRSEPSLYRVWVSEIMLQQTQVATVVDYFNRFMRRFPDVLRLSQAAEDEVIASWAGLGYYRRARQLHSAAKTIAQDYGGRFPRELDQVLALPGIGRYTAHAILSIADGQRLPILEGNTLRLFSRLLDCDDDIQSNSTQQRLWRFSESLLPRHRVNEFNQALMELGALVCRPRQPACDSCPLSASCLARIRGTQQTLPRKGRSQQFTELEFVAFLFYCGDQILMRRDPYSRWWAGMWDIPRFPREAVDAKNNELPTLAARQFGFRLPDDGVEFTIRHAVTRYRIQLRCLTIPLADKNQVQPADKACQWRWFGSTDLEKLGLNSSARKAVARCQKKDATDGRR